MSDAPAGNHHRVRHDDGVSEAIEDYAKAIYALSARTPDHAVTTRAVADRLGVSPGSASSMLSRLANLGLVDHRPYHGTGLTTAGEQIALSVLRRHRLIELFLSETLDVPWDQVHDEAEILEHHVSPRLEALIAAHLDDPKVDPHGDPIPNAELQVEEQRTISLNEAEPGAVAIFVRISDADPAMLRYLAERGITPGVRLRVIERQPFGGPVVVYAAKARHALGGTLSEAMRIGHPVPSRPPDGRRATVANADPTAAQQRAADASRTGRADRRGPPTS